MKTTTSYYRCLMLLLLIFDLDAGSKPECRGDGKEEKQRLV